MVGKLEGLTAPRLDNDIRASVNVGSCKNTVVTEESWLPNRIEALTDGVFAIAITLLVLEFKVEPEHTTSGSISESELWQAIAHVAPVFFAFALTFLVLAGAWIGHNAMMRLIRRVDRGTLWLNLFYLMFVATMPFASGIYGRFMDLRLASWIYCGNIFFIGLFQVLVWRHVRSTPDMLQPSVPERSLLRTSCRAWVLPGTAAAAALLTILHPAWGGSLFSLIPVLLLIASKSADRKHPSSSANAEIGPLDDSSGPTS